MIMQRVVSHHFTIFPHFYSARVLSVPTETHFVPLNVDASCHTMHGMSKHVRF